MSDIERLDQRLTAVERVLVDGDFALDELSDLAEVVERLEHLESRVEEHERRLGVLQGKTQSIEGFVGNVRSVNEDVEQQANAAIAAVDRVERRLDALDRQLNAVDGVDGFRPEASAAADDSSEEPRTPEGAVVGDASDRPPERHDRDSPTENRESEPAAGAAPSSASFDGLSLGGAGDSADAPVEDAVDELLTTTGQGDGSPADDGAARRSTGARPGERGDALADALDSSEAGQHDIENRLAESDDERAPKRDSDASDTGDEEASSVLRSFFAKFS